MLRVELEVNTQPFPENLNMCVPMVFHCAARRPASAAAWRRLKMMALFRLLCQGKFTTSHREKRVFCTPCIIIGYTSCSNDSNTVYYATDRAYIVAFSRSFQVYVWLPHFAMKGFDSRTV